MINRQRALVLIELLGGEKSGADLLKHYNKNNYVKLFSCQFYTLLDVMKNEGLIQSCDNNECWYRITEKGREAIKEWEREKWGRIKSVLGEGNKHA